MNDRYVDNMDKALHEYVNSVTFDGFSKKEISNLAIRAREKNKKNIFRMIAVMSFSVFISLTAIIYYNQYRNIENIVIPRKIEGNIDINIKTNIEEKPIAQLYLADENNIKENYKQDLLIYTADADVNNLSSGYLVTNPENIYVSNSEISKIYIIKVEKIIEYLFESKVPVTKFKASIIKSLKGNDSGEIELTINGGVASVFDIEKNNLNISLDKKYASLSESNKKNTFVKIISDFDYRHIEIPIENMSYIVSLDQNNKVIVNCEYPFLEFDIEKNEYKNKNNEWKEINY